MRSRNRGHALNSRSARPNRIHLILPLLVTLAVGLDRPMPAYAAQTQIGFSPPASTVQPGESFEVQVVITTDTATRGMELAMSFDPSLVQVDKVVEGTFYKDWAKANGATSSIATPFKPNNDKGTISSGSVVVLGGPPTAGPAGQGALLILSMTAKAGTKGTSPLKITQTVVSSAAAERIPGVALVDGSVVVGGEAASKPAPAQTPAPPAAAQAQEQPAATAAAAPQTAAPAPPAPPATPPTSAKPAAPSPPTAPTPQAAAKPAAVAAPSGQTPQPPAGAPPPATQPAPATPAQLAAKPPAAAPAAAQGAPAGPTPPGPTNATAAVSPVPAAGTAVSAPPAPAAPRGSNGLYLPWEVIGGVGGALVAVSLIMFALRDAGTRP